MDFLNESSRQPLSSFHLPNLFVIGYSHPGHRHPAPVGGPDLSVQGHHDGDHHAPVGHAVQGGGKHVRGNRCGKSNIYFFIFRKCFFFKLFLLHVLIKNKIGKTRKHCMNDCVSIACDDFIAHKLLCWLC